MLPDTVDGIKGYLEQQLSDAWTEYYKVVTPAREARRAAETIAALDYDAVREPAFRRLSEAVERAMEEFHSAMAAARGKSRP